MDMINVRWKNIYGCGGEIINVPITKKDKPVGVITEVNDKWIFGTMFETAVPELLSETKQIVSFEIKGV